jgi:hypothetical protein
VDGLDVTLERVRRRGHVGTLVTGVLLPLVHRLLVATQRAAGLGHVVALLTLIPHALVLRLNVRPQDLLGGRLVAAEVAHGSTVIVTVVLQPGVLILESSKPPSSRGWGGGIIRSYLGGETI